MSGFITLHRKLLDWEWYNDINTKTLFIHCLLKANWEDKNWRGLNIKRGSFVTSYDGLSKETNLTIQQIRTAIFKLSKTQEINIQTTNKYTLLSVVKYEDYQSLEIKSTHKQQTNNTQNNKQITTTNNIINKQSNISSDLKIDWEKLLNQFNKITGKNTKVINHQVKNKILARLKEGYSKQDLLNAIQNCFNDPYHKETNHKHLTLEFISRTDKMEKYSTIKSL